MTAPLIGITTYRSLSRNNLPLLTSTEAYIQSTINAGGCPLMIPLGLPDEMLTDLVSHLDGILFTGGGDVHPRRYASQPHPRVNSVDEDRDRVEISLIHAALTKQMPIFGICRGLQVINVAMGGSLYEDLLAQGGASLKHDFFPGEARDYVAHTVKIESSSHLRRILGVDEVEVNSMHHQGIRVLAPELRATAWSPDGLIEAVEMTDHPFGLAVQWHPEWLQAQLAMQFLFQEFVQAALEHAKSS
jgi:putative glutamine amidotransferase